jgi:predicted short-subunit dehydrogenase-like oxidoreductase (DUF2520 family)
MVCRFRHDNNIRYAAPVSRKSITATKPSSAAQGKPSIALVGAGRLAAFLAAALHDAGFTITEIVSRDLPRSRRRALALASKVGARAVTAKSAALDASLLWFCVPDREIGRAAAILASRLVALRLARQKKSGVRFALHSSGALSSRELAPLRIAGLAAASVHPMMTFVAGARPSLKAVPFAIEGDAIARRVARQMVRVLGGNSFSLPPSRKAAYHAWSTLTSPLLLAFLITLEDAARAAGFTPQDARRKSLPILRQTLANYERLGPARSFSGPLVRGDAETIAQHLKTLKKYPRARELYVVLARAAMRGLPVKNREGLTRALRAR